LEPNNSPFWQNEKVIHAHLTSEPFSGSEKEERFTKRTPLLAPVRFVFSGVGHKNITY